MADLLTKLLPVALIIAVAAILYFHHKRKDEKKQGGSGINKGGYPTQNKD
jgi:hypothetical protein